MMDMAGKQIIPAIIKYTTVLADSINTVKSAVSDADTSVQEELLAEVSDYLADTKTALSKLTDQVAEAVKKQEGKERAVYFKEVIKASMDELRAPVDKLEMIVDKEMWPMPSYGDLIFEV